MKHTQSINYDWIKNIVLHWTLNLSINHLTLEVSSSSFHLFLLICKTVNLFLKDGIGKNIMIPYYLRKSKDDFLDFGTAIFSLSGVHGGQYFCTCTHVSTKTPRPRNVFHFTFSNLLWYGSTIHTLSLCENKGQPSIPKSTLPFSRLQQTSGQLKAKQRLT